MRGDRASGARRVMFAALAATTTLLASAPSYADDREQCANAADQAQQSRDEGKYRRAREQLLVCARDVCPGPIKRDCLDWLNQLETVAPTVVFAAKDGTRDIADVKVSVDGVLVTEKLEGRPVQMDLGQHTFKFEYQGQTKEETVVIGAGQKGRNIAVVFGGTPAPVVPVTPGTEKAREPSLVPALIVGGIGVVGVTMFAIFGLSGKSDVDAIKDSNCKPNCKETDVDSARTKLIIADISLGVGVVALGVATYMILTRPKVDASVKSGQLSPPPRDDERNEGKKSAFQGWNVNFGPTTGGAVGSVGASF